MILASSENIEGRQVSETHGLVRGNAVRARGIGSDFVAGIRNLFGGNIPEYSDLMSRTRDQAADEMIKVAEENGADAVIGVRFTTSEITRGVSEILAYGTAVKLD